MAHIALDAMGSESCPDVEVRGALYAVKRFPIDVVLVGDRGRVSEALLRAGVREHPRLRIVHASERIAMGDAGARSYRRKPDSSLRRALEVVAAGEAEALVSAGNSAATVSHSVLGFGRLTGILRPGLAAQLPAPIRNFTLIDAGATTRASRNILLQHAVLGALYHRITKQVAMPSVGFLANGAEASKGKAPLRAALEAMSATEDLPFLDRGFIEGHDLYGDVPDVVVTDGFTGNIVLKMFEGAQALIVSQGFSFPRRRNRRRPDDPTGAPLLGVNKLVMVCHGAADERAVANAIIDAHKLIQANLVGKLTHAVEKSKRLWQQ